MEKFNQLADLILSFNIRTIQHNGCNIFVQRDPITNYWSNDLIQTLSQNAIYELINLAPDIAAQKVQYLRANIDKFQSISAQTNSEVYRQFTDICHKSFFKFNGPTLGFPEAKNPIISNIFLASLRYDIYLRDMIIKHLEAALQHTKDTEIDLTGWYKNIMKAPVNVKYTDTQIMSLIDNDLKLSLENHSVQSKRQVNKKISFKDDILNDKGKMIFDQLLKEYSGKSKGTKPKRIVAMYLALKDLNCLSDYKYPDNTIAIELISVFELNCAPRSITASMAKYSTNTIVDKKLSDRIKQEVDCIESLN